MRASEATLQPEPDAASAKRPSDSAGLKKEAKGLRKMAAMANKHASTVYSKNTIEYNQATEWPTVNSYIIQKTQ